MTKFDLKQNIFVITGGGGLMGREHAMAIADSKGRVVLTDINEDAASKVGKEVSLKYGKENVMSMKMDVTSKESCEQGLEKVKKHFGQPYGLINNAARNPKVEKHGAKFPDRLETMSMEAWSSDLSVGLTGAFIASQVFGTELARKKRGVIINIASDLGLIAPDQRIYQKAGAPRDLQQTKPITYSVIKGGLVMMTKYLATYWAEDGVRVNALCPGGVYVDQPPDFVDKLSNLIPMKRMANKEEYRGAIVFLCSDASSYMTGSNLIIDGGRTCW